MFPITSIDGINPPRVPVSCTLCVSRRNVNTSDGTSVWLGPICILERDALFTHTLRTKHERVLEGFCTVSHAKARANNINGGLTNTWIIGSVDYDDIRFQTWDGSRRRLVG